MCSRVSRNPGPGLVGIQFGDKEPGSLAVFRDLPKVARPLSSQAWCPWDIVWLTQPLEGLMSEADGSAALELADP